MSLLDLPIQMIVASTKAGGIGINGKLPWPANAKDFSHFKKVTSNSVLVMGRRTYEEIHEIKLQRPNRSIELLPGRKSVVISSAQSLTANQEIYVERSIRDSVECHYDEERSFFVIGGSTLYTEFLPYVKVIYWTVFKQSYECDTFLPIDSITRDFMIVDGREEDELYFLRCERIKSAF